MVYWNEKRLKWARQYGGRDSRREGELIAAVLVAGLISVSILPSSDGVFVIGVAICVQGKRPWDSCLDEGVFARERRMYFCELK
jgi:hypothetical protein